MSAVSTLRSGTWLNSERLKKYPVMFLAIYLLIAIAWIANSNGYLDPTGKPLGTDFLNQYAASKLILAGEAELSYDIARHAEIEAEVIGSNEFGYYGWHYPPMALLIVAPFALFSYGIALTLWMLVTLALNLFVVRKIVTGPGLIVTALAFSAVLINIGHGHNGFLTGSLLGGALYLLKNNRQVAAGILIGLLAYKPQFGVLIPLALMAGGHWRVFWAATVTACLFVTASVVAFGPETWSAFQLSTEFTRAVILEQGATGWEKIQSFFSLIRGLGGSLYLAYAIQALATLSMALAVIWLWRGPSSFNLKAAGLVVASLIATPYVLDYDLIILGLAIVFLVAEGKASEFHSWEISFLAALWVWPLIARSVAAASTIQFTPVLLSGLMLMIVSISAKQIHKQPDRA
jgi:alpha-1,2-mannosyltransferase